jgi:tetratricopeptide (TPR) repeat protein
MIQSGSIKILTDEIEPEEQFLGFGRYSQTIVNIIKGSEPNFSIGIYGEWGTGKTTLMKAVADKLRIGTDNDILTVWFNAWRYEREDQYAVVSLMKTIAYRMDEHPRYKKMKPVILKSIATIAKGVASRYLITEKSSEEFQKNFVSDMGAIAEADKDTIYFHGIKKIEHAMQQIINESPNSRVIVFIDDLDRCSPTRALEVFESIKVFLDIKGFVYVIGLSHETISKLVSAAYKDIGIDGELYIRKIIQIPILVPDWNSADIEQFIERVLSNKLDEKYSSLISQNKKLISLAVEPNPREVKRFINNFIVSYEIFSPNLDIKANELLVVQTLRVRWYNFYRFFSSNENFRQTVHDLIDQTHNDRVKILDWEQLEKEIDNTQKGLETAQKELESEGLIKVGGYLEDQVELTRKKLEELRNKQKKLGKYHEQLETWPEELRKNVLEMSSELWDFLDKHKEVTLGIINWELYRSAVESAKEIPMTGNAYYLDKAFAMMEKREYEEASKIYDRVLTRDQNNVEVLLNKGLCLYYLRRHEESINYFDRVLEINPKSVLALHRKGSALWYLGRADEANVYYSKALSINPKFQYSLYSKACNEAQRGNVKEALILLEKVIGINEKYRKLARTDNAFYNIIQNREFMNLITERKH